MKSDVLHKEQLNGQVEISHVLVRSAGAKSGSYWLVVRVYGNSTEKHRVGASRGSHSLYARARHKILCELLTP